MSFEFKSGIGADFRQRELGLIPHDQPGGPLVANLAAFWQQISPIVPVLPTVPAHKSCAVYNLAFEAFHGMEEVVGSIPTRSTNQSNNSLCQSPPSGPSAAEKLAVFKIAQIAFSLSAKFYVFSRI